LFLFARLTSDHMLA